MTQSEPSAEPSKKPEARPSMDLSYADRPPVSSFLKEVRQSRVRAELGGRILVTRQTPDAPREDDSAAATQPLDACEPRLVASRPSVDLGCSAEQWDAFMNNWARFAMISELDDESMAPQCRACLTDRLKEAVNHHRGDIHCMDVKHLLRSVRYVAVEPPIGVRRSLAHNSAQAAGEHYADFVTRVSGLISACEYKAPCPHAEKIPDPEGRRMLCGTAGCKASDYSEDVLRNVLLAGIYDEDVKKCVLYCPTVAQASPGEIAGLVEIFTRRLNHHRGLEPHIDDLRMFLDYAGDSAHICVPPEPPAEASEAGRVVEEAGEEDEAGRRAALCPKPAKISAARLSGGSVGRLAPSPDPRVSVRLQFQSPRSPIVFRAEAIADSGAQITVIPADMIYNRDIAIKRINHSSGTLHAANNVPIEVLGFAEAEIEAISPCGQRFSTSTPVYLVEHISEIFLSLEVMFALHIVDSSFPTAGSGLRHKKKNAPAAPCGCNFNQSRDAGLGSTTDQDFRHQWPNSRTSLCSPQVGERQVLQASSVAPRHPSWAYEPQTRGRRAGRPQEDRQPSHAGDYRGGVGDRRSGQWPERRSYARASPPRAESRSWGVPSPHDGRSNEIRRQWPRTRRGNASPRKPITRCWGVNCTEEIQPTGERLEVGSTKNPYEPRRAYAGTEDGEAGQRSGEGAAGPRQSSKSARSPPPMSTRFKFAQDALSINPPARDTYAGAAVRSKPRRSGSVDAGGPAGRSTEGKAVRIAAGSARASPEKRLHAEDSKGTAAGSEAGSYRRSSRDSPPEDW